MHKWLAISGLALMLALGTAGVQSAQAQFGGGHCHSPHGHYSHYGHHGIYGHPAVGYGSYRLAVPPIGYSSLYGPGLGYSSYYVAPGIGISRSSFYSGGLTPYGLGGFPGSGIGFSRGPGVQLRIGF